MNIKIGSIVFRCYEFEKMMKFWQAALGYVPVRPASGGFVILRDRKGKGPNISLDQAPKKRTRKRNWLHLDLYAEDQQAEAFGKAGSGEISLMLRTRR